MVPDLNPEHGAAPEGGERERREEGKKGVKKGRKKEGRKGEGRGKGKGRTEALKILPSN